MKRPAKEFLFVLLLIPLLAACSGPAIIDVGGTWTGELIAGTPTAIELELEQSGTSLSGILAVPGGTEEYSLNGAVNGDRVEFEITEVTGSLLFEGLVEGDTMDGWAIGFDDAGDILDSQAFTATRN